MARWNGMEREPLTNATMTKQRKKCWHTWSGIQIGQKEEEAKSRQYVEEKWWWHGWNELRHSIFPFSTGVSLTTTVDHHHRHHNRSSEAISDVPAVHFETLSKYFIHYTESTRALMCVCRSGSTQRPPHDLRIHGVGVACRLLHFWSMAFMAVKWLLNPACVCICPMVCDEGWSFFTVSVRHEKSSGEITAAASSSSSSSSLSSSTEWIIKKVPVR